VISVNLASLKDATFEVLDKGAARGLGLVNFEGNRRRTGAYQWSEGRSFVNLLESLEISENAAFSASSSGSNSSALVFICVIECSREYMLQNWGSAYCGNGVAGCNQFMMVVVYQ
jgi:hypothetical protein